MTAQSILDMWPVLTIVGSVVGTGATVKYTAAANKEKLTDIQSKLSDHVQQDAKVQLELVDRLARIETKLDDLRAKR